MSEAPAAHARAGGKPHAPKVVDALHLHRLARRAVDDLVAAHVELHGCVRVCARERGRRQAATAAGVSGDTERQGAVQLRALK